MLAPPKREQNAQIITLKHKKSPFRMQQNLNPILNLQKQNNVTRIHDRKIHIKNGHPQPGQKSPIIIAVKNEGIVEK